VNPLHHIPHTSTRLLLTPSLPPSCPPRLAKAKRERLRQAHLAPDYIPLGGAAALASADFKQSEGAVHSGSDDEQEEHIRMGFLSAGQQQAASAAARWGQGLGLNCAAAWYTGGACAGRLGRVTRLHTHLRTAAQCNLKG
jgi:hypothetical protein